MSLRMKKVNSELQKQITLAIKEAVDDPVADFLSITRVDTTADLRESKVYFSLLDETKYEYAKEILDKMSGLIRFMVGRKVRFKVLPHFIFIADDSIKYSVEIYQKIEEIKDGGNGEKEGP
ncbi:MAG: 30S ribosome-binding factor RbfA [Candidatus Omnitrophica bacterium]|nr:30S ribosome-binding factor RbfA [Candidatus Omnitrophota bacterium]MBD3269350.1 30S ribosome-binding factor RbfA [Candidatus Omnitrophota bacterium]